MMISGYEIHEPYGSLPGCEQRPSRNIKTERIITIRDGQLFSDEPNLIPVVLPQPVYKMKEFAVLEK